ncbi:HNH endonuclease, partial [Candidatus Poribacteria bacterium]|nr:HNH endonuclease [Candidatus Poribacteria bacterium]
IDGYSEMSYDEFTNTKSRSKFSMEHIIPQNPRESKVVVDDSILATTDFESQEFKENYLHSIGNLTIDPVSANASKSNQNFEYKDQKYFRRAPLMAQNELIDFQNDKTGQWDTVSISKRLETIRLFALERWNPLKPGQKFSEIAEEIPSRRSREQRMEKIFEEMEEI